MVLVSDTTAITNLIKIGRIEILKEVFGEVYIPGEVYRELSMLPHQKNILQKSNWIKNVSPKDKAMISALSKELDRGESEAIALAIELKADYLVMDEKAGRKIAQKLGIRVIGLLGVLIQAKTMGIIPEVKTLLDDLIDQADFYIHSQLYNDVLSAVNEL